MANSRICSVEDCGNPLLAKGLCNKHYLKAKKHGSPLGGRDRDKGILKFTLEVAAPCENEDCLIWPFPSKRKGDRKWRPTVYIKRKPHFAPRVICEKLHGPAPSPDHEAAHECGRGHLGCVNGSHLRWATHTENMHDKLIHGTDARGERHPKARLSEDDVRAIRRMRGTLSNAKIGRLYGVGATTIGEIFSGRNWGWLG